MNPDSSVSLSGHSSSTWSYSSSSEVDEGDKDTFLPDGVKNEVVFTPYSVAIKCLQRSTLHFPSGKSREATQDDVEDSSMECLSRFPAGETQDDMDERCYHCRSIRPRHATAIRSFDEINGLMICACKARDVASNLSLSGPYQNGMGPCGSHFALKVPPGLELWKATVNAQGGVDVWFENRRIHTELRAPASVATQFMKQKCGECYFSHMELDDQAVVVRVEVKDGTSNRSWVEAITPIGT